MRVRAGSYQEGDSSTGAVSHSLRLQLTRIDVKVNIFNHSLCEWRAKYGHF